MKNIKSLIVISSLALMGFQCKKDEAAVTPPIPGEEYITTVKLRLENAANPNDTIWATWKDLTPDDTNAPDTTLAIINVKKNNSYKLAVYIFDETKSPAVDITPDIRKEGNYHRFFLIPTSSIASKVVVTPTDYDSNSPALYIGLNNLVAISDTIASGKLEGILKHQPNTKDGTLAPGSTDIDVFFQFNITQ
jgi:hypothetical protein